MVFSIPIPRCFRARIIALCTAAIAGVALAGEVSFFVPEGHEKYRLIDSLYTLMTVREAASMKLEKYLIADKNVREDKYAVKAQYAEYLLKHHLKDTASVIKYCCAAREYLEVCMEYFQQMMSTQEGNNRASCFSLFRNARSEYSAMNDVVARYRSYAPAQPDDKEP